MNKDFLESCKILKKHYTRITADCQNKVFDYVSRKDEIIGKAKKVISDEEKDSYLDKHIKNIQENSVAKFTKELENFLTPLPNYRKDSCCQTKNIRFDDEIWDAPNPKKKSIWTKDSQNDITKINHKNFHQEESITTFKLINQFSEASTNISDPEIENYVKNIEKEDEIILQNERIQNLAPLKIIPVENNYEICLSVKKLDLDQNTDKFDENLDENFEKQNCNDKKFQNDALNIQISCQNNEKIDEKFDNQHPEHSNGDFNNIFPTNAQSSRQNNKENKIRDLKEKNPELDMKIQNFLKTVENQKMAATISMSNLTNSEKSGLQKSHSSINLKQKIGAKFFENRFKAQKEIIENQKKKLQEQEKLIEELKLKKIQEEAKISLEKNSEIYQETVKNSEKLKWKTKFIRNDEKNIPKQDDELKFSIKFVQAPKIVQVMEERAKEREERRLLIKERKRLLDEEKKRQAQEIIEKKIQEDLLEKQKRLEMLKMEREKLKQLEIEKNLERIKFLEKNKHAFLHYKKKLLYKGLNSLKQAIEDRKIKEEIAVKLYEFNTTLSFFRSWKDMAKILINEKTKKAEGHFKMQMYKMALGKWKKLHQDSIKKMQVAQDFYELKLMHRVFAAFHHLVCVWHLEYLRNCITAEQHYKRQLLCQHFDAWLTFPAIMKIERKKNERKKKWRQKVAEILPDYHPKFDD